MHWTTYGVLRSTTEEQDNILTSHAGPSDRTPREVKCPTLSAGATRIPVGTLLNYSKQGLFWHRKISANLSDIVIRGAKRISTDGRFKARNNSSFRNDPAQRLPPNADLTLAVIHTERALALLICTTHLPSDPSSVETCSPTHSRLCLVKRDWPKYLFAAGKRCTRN